MLVDLEPEEFKELRRMREESASKRPAHRPKVKFFVDENDKEKMVSVLKSVVEDHYNPLSDRFGIAGIGISKTRFWYLSYLAFAALGIIKPGNNVATYIELINDNIDKRYLVDGANVNKNIHSIINDKDTYDMYANIINIDDLKKTFSEMRLSTSTKTCLQAYFAIRVAIKEKISII